MARTRTRPSPRPPAEPPKRRRHVFLDAGLDAILRAQATRENRSVSEIVNEILGERLTRDEEEILARQRKALEEFAAINGPPSRTPTHDEDVVLYGKRRRAR